MAQDHTPPLLEVRDLSVDFVAQGVRRNAVRDVSFTLREGDSFGLLGESGAGKSTVALACMGALPKSAIVAAGSVLHDGKDISAFDRRALEGLWGTTISIVPQDPHAALNPSLRIGDQIVDVLVARRGMSREAARTQALELLETVRLRNAPQVMRHYPHQLSGGMKQRVCIARALATAPRILLLDEPTTALDVTTQASILDSLGHIRSEYGVSLLYITHDIRLAARLCDEVAIMASGEIVEQGPTARILREPQAAFTRKLVKAVADLDTPREAVEDKAPSPQPEPILEIGHLVKRYGRDFTAVDDASLSFGRGDTFAIVGESGSGKTTLGRCVMGVIEPTEGTISLAGEVVAPDAGDRSAQAKRRLGIVFQNPSGSLNPSHSVRKIIARSLAGAAAMSAAEIDRRVGELLVSVELDPSFAARFPHQLSGGQKQRVAIARAFASEPELVILDEATSSLDMTVQAAILDLLERLQKTRGTAYLFISHDMHVVRHIADHVAVMQAGRIVESGPVATVFRAPQAPYTVSLIEASQLNAPDNHQPN